VVADVGSESTEDGGAATEGTVSLPHSADPSAAAPLEASPAPPEQVGDSGLTVSTPSEAGGTEGSRPRMLILEGPPGTGKTFRAVREAIMIVDGSVSETATEVSARYRALVRGGSIVPVTFHPSYSYEDFVEGYRPVVVEGQIQYEVKHGPFRRAIDDAYVAAPLSALFAEGQLLPTKGGPPYKIDKVEQGGLVLSRKSSRSDRVNDENFFYADFWTVQRILDRGVPADSIAVSGKDYDRRRDVAVSLGFAPAQLAGISHIGAVARYVELHPIKSEGTAGGPVVLLIDEINRADLSRVFGELITLLEADKREGASEERSAILPYSGDTLTVPNWLHIIGTMNTADRSLSVFDYALRRRFQFRYVGPNSDLCPVNYGGIDMAAWLQSINDRITALLDREACLGHSEFMEAQLESNRLPFAAQPDGGRAAAVAIVVGRYAVPTLLAVSGRDWSVVKVLLGPALVVQESAVQFDSEDYDTMAAGFRIDPRCDPNDPAWDQVHFCKAMAMSGSQVGKEPVGTTFGLTSPAPE